MTWQIAIVFIIWPVWPREYLTHPWRCGTWPYDIVTVFSTHWKRDCSSVSDRRKMFVFGEECRACLWLESYMFRLSVMQDQYWRLVDDVVCRINFMYMFCNFSHIDIVIFIYIWLSRHLSVHVFCASAGVFCDVLRSPSLTFDPTALISVSREYFYIMFEVCTTFKCICMQHRDRDRLEQSSVNCHVWANLWLMWLPDSKVGYYLGS